MNANQPDEKAEITTSIRREKNTREIYKTH